MVYSRLFSQEHICLDIQTLKHLTFAASLIEIDSSQAQGNSQMYCVRKFQFFFSRRSSAKAVNHARNSAPPILQFNIPTQWGVLEPGILANISWQCEKMFDPTTFPGSVLRLRL